MEKIEFSVKDLPDGRTIVYPTTPGTVLYGESSPYGFTGVVNRAWIEATNVIGHGNYTEREIQSGWPLAMEPHRLANLQFQARDSDGRIYINTALIAACKGGTLRHKVFDRHDYGLTNGKWVLFAKWEDYAIAASDFAVWLAAQSEAPSVHIAAWFKAVGVAPAATAQPPAPTAAPVVADSPPGGVEPDKAGPLPVEQGLPTKDIAHAFDGVNGWSADRWPKNLSAAKWLHPARIAIGRAGGASSVWSPVMLAQLMHDNAKGEREKEKLMKTLNSRFTLNPALEPWRDAFNEYFATHCATD